MRFQYLHNICDGWSLLTNGNVNAIEFLGLILVRVKESWFLVNNGVDSNGGLTSLSITDDQLSLPSSNGDEHIDWFQTGLHWLVHWLSWNDTWCFQFDSLSLIGLDGTGSIDWVTKSINNSSEHFLSNGDIHNWTSSLHDITFLDFSIKWKS